MSAPSKICRKRRWPYVLLSLALIFIIGGVWAWFALDVGSWGDLDVTKLENLQQTTLVYDEDGTMVTSLHGAENRVKIPLSEVPQHVRNAFLAAEDVRFYDHKGIDIKRIFGALWADIKSGSLDQGASTLTQQLIKLSHLSREKTFARKAQEAVLAMELERRYSKDEIFEMYLNFVYFGGGAYGIEAAAYRYFDKPASALTLSEGALLAGIVKSPSNYAPHLNLEKSTERRNLILGLMVDYGFIDQAQADAASAEPVDLHEHENDASYPYGFYVDEVIREATGILGISSEELLSGGYRIHTALDTELQATCEALLADDSLFPEAAEDGVKPQGALVVVRAQDGAVAAVAGGRSHDTQLALNRATQQPRQPGSTFKPIFVYAPAVEQFGYLPTRIVDDSPGDFNGYAPKNFGDKYYGLVPMRFAIANSLNLPAVRTLQEIGIDTGLSYARSLGIDLPDADATLSSALGGLTTGVTPLQLAHAYIPFARQGQLVDTGFILSIKDSTGATIYEKPSASTTVLSSQSAFLLSDMMHSTVTDGTGKQLQKAGVPLSAKTGTVGFGDGTIRDAWMAAYNAEYIAVGWMGYDVVDAQHTMPASLTGGKAISPFLLKVFQSLYPDGNGPAFEVPDGLVKVEIDADALEKYHQVLLPASSSARTLTEYFPAHKVPTRKAEAVAPKAPTDLTVTELEPGRVLLKFTALEADVRYRIYRRSEGQEAIEIGSLSGSAGQMLSYNDTLNIIGPTGYYVVPEREGKSGPPSATVTIGGEMEPSPSPSADATPSASPSSTPEVTPSPSPSPPDPLAPIFPED